ncbi:MAG: hypothetical protein DI537_13650 [Stutzerimonas stutzeri]|nr:MAG: hypothetical protein DI537_13650 [Stutzerimonas stutzeri]
MKRSLLGLLAVGRNGSPPRLAPGPLTPGIRAIADIPRRLKRKDPDEDLIKRVIFAEQTGQLPAVLARLRPRLASSHVFPIVEAKVLGAEIGSTVYELVAAGLNVEHLSRHELREFVEERLFAAEQEWAEAASTRIDVPSSSVSAATPQNTTTAPRQKSGGQQTGTSQGPGKSAFFEV